jgi:hypothetical protein
VVLFMDETVFVSSYDDHISRRGCGYRSSVRLVFSEHRRLIGHISIAVVFYTRVSPRGHLVVVKLACIFAIIMCL